MQTNLGTKRSDMLIAGCATILTIVLFLFSFRYRFLDQFVIGSWHGNIGADFFSVPRGFLNLLQNTSMFDTAASSYGPYATQYFFHPAVAVLLGSWLSLFSPMVAFWVWVVCSIVLLLYAGHLFRQDSAVAYPVMICSFPVYLMLWNAQMHVFTVLALALVVSGVLDYWHERNQLSRDRKIMIGVLVSLLTKPMIVIVLPYLLVNRELRRPLFVAGLAYAGVSLACVFLPPLNPAGDNLIHWTNIVQESGKINPLKAEMFSLPVFVKLLYPVNFYTGFIVKLPLFASFIPLIWFGRLRTGNRRFAFSCLGVSLVIFSYYLAYTTVWEYHYATLYPVLIGIWILIVRGEIFRIAWMKWLFLACGATLFLPTTAFLHRNDLVNIFDWITLCRATRVVPIVIGYLLLYWELLNSVRNRTYQ